MLAINCYAENGFNMTMRVVNSDGAYTERAAFGIDENATNGLDEAMGEFEIPNFGPNVIAAGFWFYEPTQQENILSYKDFRSDFASERDSIVFNLETSGLKDSYKLVWGTFPEGIKRATMKSKYLSVSYNYIDMKAGNSLDVVTTSTETMPTNFVITLYNFEDETDGVKDERNITSNVVRDYIELNEFGRAELYDINGNIVLREQNAEILDVRNLPCGVYFLKTENSSQKVIKE